jgi:hypothetical protein
LTPIFISITGWRKAWMIGGCFSIVIGLLMVLTVDEPVTKDAILVSNDVDQNEEVKKQAIKIVESNKGY